MMPTEAATHDGRQPSGTLTDQFYRARRSLMLFSGLLFVWEFLQVRVTEVQTAGLKVDYEEEATPFVLLGLVVYYTARTTVEWYQSPLARRRQPASRADAFISTGITLGAVLTFGAQGLSEFRLADFVTANWLEAGVGLFAGWGVGLIAAGGLIRWRIYVVTRRLSDRKVVWAHVAFGFIVALLPSLATWAMGGSVVAVSAATATSIGWGLLTAGVVAWQARGPMRNLDKELRKPFSDGMWWD